VDAANDFVQWNACLGRDFEYAELAAEDFDADGHLMARPTP
jgi:hypothetical protein